MLIKKFGQLTSIILVFIATAVTTHCSSKSDGDQSPITPRIETKKSDTPSGGEGSTNDSSKSGDSQAKTNTDLSPIATAVPTAPVPASTGVTSFTELFAKLSPNHSATYPYYDSNGTVTGNLPGFGPIDTSASIAIYMSGSGPTRRYTVSVFLDNINGNEIIVDTYPNFALIGATAFVVPCIGDSGSFNVGSLSDRILNLDNPVISNLGGTFFSDCANTQQGPASYRYKLELLDNNRVKFTKSGLGIRKNYPAPSVSSSSATLEGIFDFTSGIH